MAASTVQGPMQPVMPGLNAELAPVKVDHQMATTVPGLFAIGDTCYAGTCLAGAVPAPPGRMRGSGLGFATYSGVRCAPAAVAAARAASGRPDAAQAETLKARVFAPLGRSGMAAPEMVRAVQDVMAPVGYSIYKRADRMNEALDKVLALKAQVPTLAARGPALPGCLPRRRVHGARRRDVLPRLARCARSRAAGTCVRTSRSATTRTS